MRLARNFIYDPSLVLYLPLYKLDGSSFMDRSAYGHLCTVTGALWTPRGRNFDNVDDFISCGNPTQLQISGTTPFTMIVWFNADTLGGGNTLLAKDEGLGAVNKWWLHYRDATNGLAFHINSPANEGFYFNSTFVPSSSTWYQVALTRTGNDWTFYVDAISRNTLSSSQVMRDANANFEIGRFQGGSFWDGLIGKVWVYKNKALTPIEIQHNYLMSKRTLA